MKKLIVADEQVLSLVRDILLAYIAQDGCVFTYENIKKVIPEIYRGVLEIADH